MTGDLGGQFITVEGIEGAGKSTQAALLEQAVLRTGRRVVRTREPGGGGRVGETMRDLLKDPGVWRSLELTEVFLYAAARAHNLESVIIPELRRGSVVICDRYLDSTLAYQGYGRGRPIELIERLHALPPLELRPVRTLLFDAPPEVALERARNRTLTGGAGYDDEDVAFFTRVRDGYLRLAAAHPDRYRVIAADRAVNEVHRDVLVVVGELFEGLAPGPEGA